MASGDFNLPDDVTGEMVDAAHSEPGDTCMTCRHCLYETCDMGLCALKLAKEPGCLDGWQDVIDYIEVARVDMQSDVCGRWVA